MLADGDINGLIDCTCINYDSPGRHTVGFDVANACPHDGQRYMVCLSGNAKGGCRLENEPIFPLADCAFPCWFQFGVSLSVPVGARECPSVLNPSS